MKYNEVAEFDYLEEFTHPDCMLFINRHLIVTQLIISSPENYPTLRTLILRTGRSQIFHRKKKNKKQKTKKRYFHLKPLVKSK